MSLPDAPTKLPTIRAISEITGLGLTETARRLKHGEPIATYLLHQSDHEEVALILRRLADFSDQEGFEMAMQRKFQGVCEELSKEGLRGLLDRWDSYDEDMLT